MPDGVMGIVDAALDGLIAHVDGIVASLRNGWIPSDGALHAGVADGSRLSGGTCFKGVLTLLVATFVEGKAGQGSRLPIEQTFGLSVA